MSAFEEAMRMLTEPYRMIGVTRVCWCVVCKKWGVEATLRGMTQFEGGLEWVEQECVNCGTMYELPYPVPVYQMPDGKVR